MVKRFDWYKGEENEEKKQQPQNPTKLRHNVQAGQVLVILSGRFRGKRVVFLKQLQSGYILVTGPYKVNGVPLLRLPQKHTLTTSKIIDVAGVNTDNVTDAYFKKDKKVKGTKEEQFFQDGKKKKAEVSQEKKDTQKAVDASILAAIKGKTEAKYLRDVFTLHKGQKAHELVF
ncbi:unnamed protein product [Moneuplotes crassus]|uniref:60S ribosomal protein L6 n=1 Tax=Euplotes crassus TaxID=5936 RepID=A0AAD2D362_EUPCR|nr:unnamed protein product [Moneuplotes crassus]|eukprot:CAMPEP_0196995900 /NCGR_PEP_ID=MMETSP1380-20130617/1908_1 /TAXON_ID=5936 /ORGANISM="Euplotes crassus, Strain CT5" /LENGTH=172 /DNA_ID=CAMNT_0042411703 /DNA_START=15 /DNA_END=533 /DNA_ORIENTATION=+